MKNITIMIKPASSLCNMRCRYCFYSDIANQRQVNSYGIMDMETTQKILENIRIDFKQGDQIQFSFQGGEPTLAGLEYFRHFINLTRKWDKGIKISYTLQTNGINLDDEWCEFLARNHFLVGVSLDLLPFCHDEARVDVLGEGTYQRVRRTVQLLEQHHVEYNILCTLTEQIARYPQKVWKTITKYDYQWVQFTPCLNELSGQNENPYSLKPQSFASFYIQLFACWLSDFQKNAYRSIKLFDDIVNYLAYGVPTSCGIDGKCQPQLIIEADGSAYPCDFYCLDEYLLGSFTTQTFRELFLLSVQSEMRKREKKALCESCPYVQICGGGCKRMQDAMYCRDGETYCGMQAFLQYSMGEFQKIAQRERLYARGLR